MKAIKTYLRNQADVCMMLHLAEYQKGKDCNLVLAAQFLNDHNCFRRWLDQEEHDTKQPNKSKDGKK